LEILSASLKAASWSPGYSPTLYKIKFAFRCKVKLRGGQAKTNCMVQQG